jgi:5-methylcytosine-specific restriction endonuclease McrA
MDGKRCKGPCGLTKPLSDFHEHPQMADGHLNFCKVCRNAYVRSRAHMRDPEKERDRLAAWRAANPVAWRAARDKAQAKRVASGKANKDRAARRAREASGQVSHVRLRQTLEQYGMRCSICLKPIEHRHQLSFDHVIPLARGGAHSEENLLPAHLACNSWKNDRLPEEIAGLTPPATGSPEALAWELRRAEKSRASRSESSRRWFETATEEQKAERARKISLANTGRKHPVGHKTGGARVLTSEQLEKRAVSVRAFYARWTPEQRAAHSAKIRAAKASSKALT